MEVVMRGRRVWTIGATAAVIVGIAIALRRRTP